MNDLQLLEHLKNNIPLTALFGMQKIERLKHAVRLWVELKPHLNHKKTAYGGSLYSLSALTCYAWLWSALPENGVPTDDIVIQTGEMKYFRPVDSDFVV